LKGIIEFLRAAGRLKGLPRTGWLEAGVETPESVAEHSYRTAVLAVVLADLEGLDAGKAARMALLHDLAEAETGDLTPEQKGRLGPAYSKGEAEAVDRALSSLPEPLAEAYRAAWREYHGMASPEAEAVAQADKVEMLLQALEYEEEGIDPSRLDRFWSTKVEGGPPSELAEALSRIRRLRLTPP